MSRVFGTHAFSTLFAAAAIAAAAAGAPAQDLGSSSGIFRSPSAAKTSAAPKTVKPKTAASAPARKPAPKPAARPARSAVRPGSRAATAARTEPVVVDPQQQSTVVITVGNPANANYDELFEQAVEEGNVARDERDYPRAEAAYRRAQTLKSRDSRAVYGLGNIFADQQRWEEAERAYRQAIALDAENAGAHIALSYVLTQPIAAANLSDRYAEAERSARRAIELDPRNAFAFDQLGVALELRGIIGAETENAYRSAIGIEPEFALAYAHLGRLLRRNGKTSESADAYGRAIRLSSDVPTMILVADVMQSQQRFSESEQLLRRAIAADAKNPTALNLLGRALTTRGEFDEAEKLLKKSVEVSPTSFVSYALLSSLYLRRARPDEAEKTLGRALAIVSPAEKKRLAQEFAAIGDAFKKSGKPADAERLYRQAAALDAAKTPANARTAGGRE